jgi:hypothetical protein
MYMGIANCVERSPAILVKRPRHPGVIVAESVNDYGHDLQVNITHGSRFSGRLFAVVLKARVMLDGIGKMVEHNRIRLRTELSTALTKSAHSMRDLPFPLLFMAFSMDSDRAFFGWLRKPSNRSRRLENPEVKFALEWTSDTHVGVIREVEVWYGASEG